MRGRRPKPSSLKLLGGNAGHRPIQNEPKPEVEKPSCPPELSKAAKKEWRRVVAILLKVNVLSTMDRSSLAAYCQSYARWIEAEQKLAETSLVIKTKSGNVIENPFYSISKRERELMHKFMCEFGLTPAARTRLDIKPPKQPSPWDKYFERNH